MAVSASSTVFKINDGTTLQTITCDLNGVTLNRERGFETFETFCAVEKSPQNVDTTIDLTGRWDGTANAIDDVMDTLINLDTKTLFEYYPEGTTGGNVRYYGSGFVTAYSISASVPGVVEVSATVEVDGAIVRGTA